MTGRAPAATALAILFCLLTVLSNPPASAQFYWDTNGNTPGSGNAGGLWNEGTAAWSTDPAGAVATQTWADGNRAIFSAGTDGIGLREIGVTGAVNPNGILVKDGIASFTSGIINSSAVVQANNNATLRIDGASVTASLFEAGRGTFGTIDVVSGSLSANAIDVGNPGNVGGAVLQSGGAVNLDGVGRPGNVGLRLGHWGSTVPSTYEMTGGSVNVTASGGMHIGWDGPGQFTMNGASAAINTPQMRIGSPIGTGGSTLNLQDGTINARFVDLGVRGGDRPGTINQTGGSLVVQADGGGGTPELRIGHWPGATSGTYNLTGGTLDTTGAITRVGWDGRGELNIGGNASFDAGNINVMQASLVTIGDSATVDANNLKLVQGGVLTINGSQSASFNDLALGGTVDGRSGTGTLNINGGVLQTGRLSVGDSSGGHAGFVNQAGGDFAVGGQFLLGHWGNNTSVYNMSGGSLTLTGTPAGGGEQAGGIYIGIDGSGIFNHSDGTVTTSFLWLDNRGQTAGPHQYNLTGGELVLTSAIGIGSSNPGNPDLQVNLGGGTITANTNTAINVAPTLTGSGGNTTFNPNGNTLTVPVTLSGPGGMSVEGGGTLLLTTVNSYAGGAVINGATLRQTGYAGSTGAGAGSPDYTINSGGRLQLASSYFAGNPFGAQTMDILVNSGGTMEVVSPHALGGSNLNGGSWRTVTLDGGTLTLTREQYVTGGTLNGNGRLVMTGGLIDGPNELRATSQAGGAILTVLPNATPSVMDARLSAVFGGWTLDVREDARLHVTGTIAGANAAGLTVTGGGTTLITGDTSYSGPTNVQAGTLLMSGNHSASTGDVTVQAGATLGGTGIIGGATLINSDAVISPGESAGTLTFNQDLTLAPGSTFSADVLFGGTTTDLVVMNQGTALTLDGAVLAGTWGGSSQNVFGGSYSADTMFWIVDNQGGNQIDGTFANSTPAPGFAGLFDGVTPHLVTVDDQLFAAFYESRFGTFSQAGLTNGNDLLLIAIPEPSRALLLSLAAATLLLRRRR